METIYSILLFIAWIGTLVLLSSASIFFSILEGLMDLFSKKKEK